MDYITYAVLLALGFDGDSENDDDAFVRPIASWFILIDDRLQNQTDSKQ